MGRERARSALTGMSTTARAMTYVPRSAVDLLFGDDSPPEPVAHVALATEVGVDLTFVPSSVSWAFDAIESLHDHDIGVAWSVDGVVGRTVDVLGWPETLRLSASRPGDLAETLAAVLGDALVSAREGLTRGADALVVADDLASDAGWLLAPDFALDVLVPCYASFVAEADASGVPLIFHSDGDVRSLLPALAREGVHAVHPGGLTSKRFDSWVAAARATGLVTLGGLPGRELLHGAGHAARRASATAQGGGLIVADDGGISSGEELAAFVSAMRAI